MQHNTGSRLFPHRTVTKLSILTSLASQRKDNQGYLAGVLTCFIPKLIQQYIPGTSPLRARHDGHRSRANLNLRDNGTHPAHMSKTKTVVVVNGTGCRRYIFSTSNWVAATLLTKKEPEKKEERKVQNGQRQSQSNTTLTPNKSTKTERPLGADKEGEVGGDH